MLCTILKLNHRATSAPLSLGTKLSEIYHLVKDHKKYSNFPPFRPVASCPDSLPEKVSFLLSVLLSDAIQLVPSYIDSPEDFLHYMTNVESKFPCSTHEGFAIKIDSVATYPNLPIDEGLIYFSENYGILGSSIRVSMMTSYC